MNKKVLLFLLISLSIMINGCASITKKDTLTQDSISKPISFCKLDKASISDIPIYDDSNCYNNRNIKGFYLEERYGKKTMFAGRIFDDKGFSSTWYLIDLPNQDFFSQKLIEGDRYEYYRKLPDNQCVKKQGTALSKEKTIWKGSETDILEVIVRKKITEEKRQEMLKKKQRSYQKQYEDCNAQYESILHTWSTEVNTSNFCNSIRAEWMKEDCKRPFTRECANLANPFIECYKQGHIKVNSMYIYNVF